jgi:diacylglycerol kinase family enzyme
MVRVEKSSEGAPSPAGTGFAILVNANAKRGGRRIAAELGRVLPGARVRLTRTPDEIVAWLATLTDAKCIFAAGGDGTSIALVNALARVTPKDEPLPILGLLPLGTGNAWARCVGARKLGGAVRILESGPLPTPIPTRRFGLVECEDKLTSFAGCGWDAQVLNDYRTQVQASKGPAKAVAKSVYGYLSAMLFRTAPKVVVSGRPHVIVENLGDEVWTMTHDRKLVKLEGVRHGSVLYDGLASVTGAASVPEFGFGFRAFPHAERFLGLINVRVYDRHVFRAIKDIPKLWRGEHPLRGMHDWFATAVRMTFSRPMPLQIGGDAVGHRQTIEYRVGSRQIDVLDWRAL